MTKAKGKARIERGIRRIDSAVEPLDRPPARDQKSSTNRPTRSPSLTRIASSSGSSTMTEATSWTSRSASKSSWAASAGCRQG